MSLAFGVEETTVKQTEAKCLTDAHVKAEYGIELILDISGYLRSYFFYSIKYCMAVTVSSDF